MKQFNFEFTSSQDASTIIKEIYNYTGRFKYKSILFHLYSILFNDEEIKRVQEEILEVYPDARICGTSSNGDICDGHLAEFGMVMAVSIFESTDTTVHLFECKLGQESEVGRTICKTIDDTPSVKAAEILITLKTISSSMVLKEAEKCREDVRIFGGGSAALNIEDTDTRAFNKTNIVHSGVILITYQGSDLHVDISHAIGWKPLGKNLKVTKIQGKTLYELDGKPAGDIYRRYLDIQFDENFFTNILEFPIMSYQYGNQVLRLPFSCNAEDGSMILAADLYQCKNVNLSYGDPDVIREEVKILEDHVRNFAPQAIFLYSCGVRRLYWKYLLNKETGRFSRIAPVCGFYSSGELMRMGKNIIEHHVTLIAISMREGEKDENEAAQETVNQSIYDDQPMHNQTSMVRRLANFINVTARELHEANEELQQMADTDELTGLYNRRMLDKLVRLAINQTKHANINMVLGIIDIDDFKKVNDTYGHAEGDEVLKIISAFIKESVDSIPSGICGRWGGEEFLFLLPNISLDEGMELMEKTRVQISDMNIDMVGHKTVSIGMTQFSRKENAEVIFERADKALYVAKTTGKNKIEIL